MSTIEPTSTNDTTVDWTWNYCVHELFEAQVLNTPDAIAIECGKSQLTYRELNARANQLAHHLRQLTSGMDVPIGICVERSLEMAIGILAILKSGAAYLPLDPEYPEEVLRRMIEQALVPVVLTQTSVATRIPQTRAVRVFVDSTFPGPDQNPHRRIAPGNLACVIYTSGSTGLPRAVAMPHRPLVNLLAWHSRAPAFASPARTLQFASLSFELSFQEMFSTWCSGGTLVLISEETRRAPTRFIEFLKSERIERVFLSFPALQQLAETSSSSGIVPCHLRDVISTGEQLRICPTIIEFFEKLGGSCRLHNHYSLSEAHVTTVYTLTGAPREWPRLPPIGVPITNVEICILDADLKPAPCGVPGEIFIRGECLAQGYLYRPALTAQRFMGDSVSRGNLKRVYRTGDIGRQLADGNIEFLGRLEEQVDIGGTRVEPSAVDAFLSQHPGVRACVTVAIGTGCTDKRLCSYVVPRDRQPSEGNLRRFLQASLPRHLIPSEFGFLDALPLTPNGKVDRNLLLTPDGTSAQLLGGRKVTRSGAKSKRKPTQSYEMAISYVEADSSSNGRPHMGRIPRQ